MLIAEFVYKIYDQGFVLWLDGKKVKYRQYKPTDKFDEIIRLIGVYKKEIIKFLEFNNCYDAPIFIPDHIYKLNELKMQLSFAQERVWFIERYEGGTHAYNIPLVFKLKDLVDIGILERSIGEIVRRHEVLRTVICEDGEGRGYQEVLDHDTHPILLRIKEVHGRKDLDEVILEEVRHVFDLSKEHPIRINLYNVSESQDRYLSIVCHHIAFDGWSVDIFCKELESFYDYFMGEREGVEKVVDIASLPIQYKDFALWQKSYLTGERLEKQLNYWRGELAGYETLNLITDKPRPSKIDYRGADVHFEIDEKVSAGLRSLAKELKVSLYSLLLSGYYLLLRAYSNQDDIVIGSPIANRHYSQIENLIGFFVNTLALRCTIKSDLLLCDFIKMVGSKVVEAQSYQDLPFEKLVDALNIDKDMSRHPIFQVCFGLQGFGGMDEGKILAPYITDTSFYNIAKFDLSTSIDDRGGHLKGSFNYAISLYNEDTISGFSRTYQIILNQISSLASDASKQGALRISDLSYLPKEEYKKIIYDWNATDKPYPNHSTIHGLFEEQVLRTPDNIAVVYGSTRLTYRELNIRANRLAHYLKKLGIGKETLVATMFSSPLHFVIGIIAILKAGGAYVPIDPDLPISRLQYILDDIKAYIILVDSLTGDKIPSTFARIICLDESQKLINQSSPDNLSLATNSSQLAYVIYTSGTTGKAKGVMIEHQGVVSLATADYVMIGIEDICIQLSDMSFDAATFEIWSILLNGAGLLMLEEPNKLIANTDCLQQKLIEESITIMWLTRSLFDQLYLLNKNLFKSLNYLLVGGEALNKKLISELLLSDTRPKHLINGYGPTENTTFSCTYNIESKGLINSANVSIGRPISNRKAYILTNDMNPSPIGAIGELYVGGAGLARGYLNNTALTKERFILNPYQTSEEKNLGTNKSLYKTGDIARWLSDGNIEYIGRKDFQVKIRGYRIELGEIESVLLNYQGIDQCVALLKESKLEDDVSENKYLVAYYVSHKSLSEEDIFSYLRRTLPEYMIPNSLVYLENLPLTVNGKLDIKALPEHNLTNEKQYVAPRNDIEKIICTVWGECLGILSEKIGIHDDFFMLGGNSLLAIKIISKMRSNANLDISIMDLFQYKTIALILSNHSIKQNNINKESESKLYEEFHV